MLRLFLNSYPGIFNFNQKVSGANRMNWESSKVSFFPVCSVSPPPLRVVYLRNKLPEGVRGRLNIYEPDSLTSQQNSCKHKNIHIQTNISNLSQLSTKPNFYSELLFTGSKACMRENVRGHWFSERRGEDIELKVWAVSIKFKISMLVTYISSPPSIPPSSLLPLSVKSSLPLIWK